METQVMSNHLLDMNKGAADIEIAVRKGEFFVHATPTGNGFSICMFEHGGPNWSYFFATESEALAERNDISELYNQQITVGDRVETDVWDGVVLKAKRHLEGDLIALYQGDTFIGSKTWKSLSGL
ncbi:hypothetical protein Ping_2157 [Psychromonas ingrahamii 37]|uniref:Uncharacterized protein n=1 Tax=Psychromonas ingrahamii (strain DSM 17664 / CCUG 51855 / 37) TaxID=357804 RepID=A1SWN4_PSYIN|nr:hypothetical protein [Psychromonas ingrahamii]ABM03899.1 hypothetical protein Ping_2157 [Psychromonas ingrahamii 37]